MIDWLDIEDLHIPVVLRLQKRKTLSLTVSAEGELLVKAPFGTSEQKIERFVKQKQFWIYKQVKRQLLVKINRIERSEKEILELFERARQDLTRRTERYAKRMEVAYARIRIGNQKSLWGSRSSNGTISYNWRLILMPEEIRDYVVVHELSHAKYMNHSVQFWKTVEEILPDYKTRRKWLKEHGREYDA